MQVTFNIESGTMGVTVEEVFKQLTSEQRLQLAEKVMKDFLVEPHNSEREAYEKNLIPEIRGQQGSEWVNGWTREFTAMTEADIRATERFKSKMRDFKSTRDRMIEMIVREATQTYKDKVVEFVKHDPQIQEVMKATLDEIRLDFPKYAHDAVTAYFITNMQSMASTMLNSLMAAGSAQELSQKIQRQLQERGLHV